MNYLGLEDKQVNATVNALNSLLANYQIYYQNLRNFHWNIEGENFFELHQQFEDLYNDARLKIDEIAERVLTLRHRPWSTLSTYLEKAQIQEADEVADDRKMVSTILSNHKVLIQSLRKVISRADASVDEGTIDMMGGFLENLEKKSWMLDAWLSKHN